MPLPGGSLDALHRGKYKEELPQAIIEYDGKFFMYGSAIIGVFLLIANRRNLSFLPQSKELPVKGRFTSIWCNLGMALFVLGCFGLVLLTFLG